MAIPLKKMSIILLITAALLLIPCIAMQFTDEVQWDIFDFLIMGALLLTLGFIGNWALYKIKNPQGRVLTIVGIIILFLLIWAELAVGIFGTLFA